LIHVCYSHSYKTQTKIIMILLVVLTITFFSSIHTEKTPGQVLDEKFRVIEKNYSVNAITQISLLEDLKKKYLQLEQDIKVFKIIHGACAPCTAVHGTSEYCDCRNLEPKQDCLEFYQAGVKVNGMYKIIAEKFTSRYAFCDQISDGGGWTVFQRRKDGSTDFYRNWQEYKNGFGHLESELWFGNENLHDLTKTANAPKKSTLMINMKINEKKIWAKYNSFEISNEASKYVLNVSGFSGNTTDRFGPHNGMMFSTHDSDNDVWRNNCASAHKGGWWYHDCHYSHLNGVYGDRSCNGITWPSCSGYPTFTTMKVRRNI